MTAKVVIALPTRRQTGARTFVSAAVSDGDLGLNFAPSGKAMLAADRNVRAPVRSNSVTHKRLAGVLAPPDLNR
jgi:hypothetical protein